MGTRQRISDVRVICSGRRRRYFTWYPNNAYLGYYTICTDEDEGWGMENPFDLNRNFRQCGVVNGTSASGLSEAENYVLTNAGQLVVPSADTMNPVEDWTEIALNAAAAMNPQRPGINLPAVIGEASDIPSMFMDVPNLLYKRGKAFLSKRGRPSLHTSPAIAKALGRPSAPSTASKVMDAARRAASTAGSQYVGAQFGWKPFIGDLSAMLGLQQAIARQLSILVALLDGRSIKCRIRLPAVNATLDKGSIIAESSLAVIHARVTEVYRVKRWCTARYESSVLTPYLLPSLDDPAGMVNLAMRLATGMTRMGLMQAWWELLPWSWLMDWWWNFGRLLAVVGNSLALTLVSLCYMRTSWMTRYYAYSDIPSWLTYSGGPDLLWRCHKYRRDLRPSLVIGSVPSLSLPTLTGRQAAILGGILAQGSSRGL